MGSKIVLIYCGGSARAFSVDESWEVNGIAQRYNDMLDDLKRQTRYFVSNAIPNKVLKEYGFRPYRLSQVYVEMRDTQSEAMHEHGLDVACCYNCTSCEEGTCMKYGGFIEDEYEEKECCRNEKLYSILYAKNPDGPADIIGDFILEKESLLDDMPKLRQLLSEFFPQVAVMKESDSELAGLTVGKI